MNFMKHNVLIVIVAIIIASSSAADEAKSSSKQQQQIQQSQNNVPFSSPANDAKQQNKRLAYFAPSSTLSSGFKPITASYPTASSFLASNQFNHYHYPQQSAYASGLSSSYVKHPYGSHPQLQQPFVSPSNVKFSSSYSRGAPLSYGYNTNQQLAFAASQPAAVSYVHSPYQLAQQIFAQQLPLHNYNVHQLAPIIHAPTMGLFGPYQGPVQSSYYPTLNNKYPQQSHTYSMPSHSSSSHSKQQIITSKPVALEHPQTTPSSNTAGSSSSSSSSEVHHNHHGAVSYSTFLQPADKIHHEIPTAPSLIATQPPSPHLYYHHSHQHQAPPQTFVDYPKHHGFSSSYSLPIATNYYSGFNSHTPVHSGFPVSAPAAFQPYAHISKISVIPTQSVPTPQVVSVNVVPTIPQKISLH